MKDKIWRGEFVDMFSLLFRVPEPKPGAPGPAVAGKHEQYKTPKVEHNGDNQLSGYIRYLQAYPWKSITLLLGHNTHTTPTWVKLGCNK